jgi:hypothetical protein
VVWLVQVEMDVETAAPLVEVDLTQTEVMVFMDQVVSLSKMVETVGITGLMQYASADLVEEVEHTGIPVAVAAAAATLVVQVDTIPVTMEVVVEVDPSTRVQTQSTQVV